MHTDSRHLLGPFFGPFGESGPGIVEVCYGGYAANEYGLVSELCGAQDEVGTASALQKYAEMDVQFTDTREYKLLRDIQAAQEEALPQPLLRRCTCADRARKDDRTAVHVCAGGRMGKGGTGKKIGWTLAWSTQAVVSSGRCGGVHQRC